MVTKLHLLDMVVCKKSNVVEIVSYLSSLIGSQPIDQLTSHQNVVIKEISIPNTKDMSFFLSATLKILAQVFGIIKAFYSDKSLPKWTLVQSPPSIPTLYVAQLLAVTSGTKLIIDWHNTAYSLLALKFSPSHPIVKISQM